MVGQNIGKYQVLDRIGRGGMGTVYRAMDETLRREVAIKVLNAELNDPAVAKRFHAEAITVARLNHPGIATVYELFQNDGQWLMVMEFVRGETLEGLVMRKGPLALEEAVDISMQALGALAHAHSLGVVHRDLKPANLMFGDSGLVKIMDFGIARVAGTEHLTNAGFMMGTPAYMAPEQVLGEDIDARCDIYAMGAVLFYLLTGQLPFKGKSPFEMAQAHLKDQPILLRTIRMEMPEWAEQIIDRALQREPQKRFQSAPLFHDALRRGLSGLPIDAAPASPIPAELMATAPPGGLPVAGAPTATTPASAPPEMMETILASPPRHGAPLISTIPESGSTVESAAPAATSDAPTIGAAIPVSDANAPTIATSASRSFANVPPPTTTESASARPSAAPAPSSRAPLAIAAAAVIVIAVGAFVWMGGRSSAPAEPVTATGESAPVAALSQETSSGATPQETATTAPAGAEGQTAGAPPADVAAATETPAAPVLTDTPASSLTATSGVARGTSSPRDGRAASGATRAGSPETVAPVATSSLPAETFKDVRLLVITGKKADERPVTLRFGDGMISAISERDGSPIASISDKDVSYASFTRAKEPRWSPILAAPPADTDLPGGLFRSARNWLTLQSRASFLILRLNDSDLRRIIDAVNHRTTVKVDTSAQSAK